MIPHLFQQLQAFSPEYAEPIDVTTCITRFPPNDAPCPQGHPYNAENTLVSPIGQRSCRICKRIRSRGPNTIPRKLP